MKRKEFKDSENWSKIGGEGGGGEIAVPFYCSRELALGTGIGFRTVGGCSRGGVERSRLRLQRKAIIRLRQRRQRPRGSLSSLLSLPLIGKEERRNMEAQGSFLGLLGRAEPYRHVPLYSNDDNDAFPFPSFPPSLPISIYSSSRL